MMLRLRKGGKTRHEAHIHEQLLTAAQGEVLAKWIKVQGRRGVPLMYTSIAMYAGEICGRQVGGSWPKRFLKRHPDLRMKKTQGLETARAKVLNQTAVDEFFDMLDELVKEYNILPGNMYNMDEKGVQLGIGAKVTVMVDRDQKTAYSIEDGNQELVTVIEAICADGSILHPSIIFQGKQRNSEWGRNNPSNARYWFTYVFICDYTHWPLTVFRSLQMDGQIRSWGLHGYGMILIPLQGRKLQDVIVS